jgi:hypothetical protein
MGGVFSCVRDLTRWVAGFAAAFPPGQDDDTHPVRRASRREMQLPQVLTGWAIASSFPGDGASSSPATYGFGLFVDEHPALAGSSATAAATPASAATWPGTRPPGPA